ncbi:MAG: hypothetical protein WA978_16985 [Sphingopyxis granuli]|uniref:hypothetical protein n=1 Tax=Sphingopyxis granuli TaxID=267128 RepID=UPI003C751E4F
MKFGNSQDIGRHIVDIDGCLKATDLGSLGPSDIIALHGGLPADALIALEIYDELVPLGAGDRVALNESSVAFFRSFPGGQAMARHPGRLHNDAGLQGALRLAA